MNNTTCPICSIANVYQVAMQQHLKAIGIRMSDLRKAQQKDVKTVTEQLDLLLQTLYNIEDGENPLRITTMEKLCSYYGVKAMPMMQAGPFIKFNLP